MKFSQLSIAVIGAAVFAPVMLLGQDPLGPGASQTQPNPPGQQQAASSAIQDTNNSGVTGQMMRDQIFLKKATEGGLAEVQLGQLATQKGSSDDVKAFGQKMVTDHTELNQSMEPVADSLGVRLPKKINKKDQAEYDKLNGLSGADFDTEYLTYMVKDHHQDLHEFRAEAMNATDPGLRAAVEKGEKVIREHTRLVDKLARDKGIAVPSHRPVPAPPPAAQ